MQTLILVLHVILCIFLIIVVLLQPGKGGDAGVAFGGGGSQTVFGARGATTFLQKLTTYAAVLFMVTTITLAWYSSESVSRESVIDEGVLKNLATETDAGGGPASLGGAPEGAGGAAPSSDAGGAKPGAALSGEQAPAPEGAASPGTGSE